MRGGRATTFRLVVLALALRGLLGANCGGGESRTWVALVPDASSVEAYSLFTVEILVTSPTPIQAFELGLQWDPEMLEPVNVAPHPDFDDDGAFFTSPQYDLTAGTLDRLVDLRHGGEGAEGSFNIATVEFLSLGAPGATSIGLTSGGLADGNGNEPSLTSVVPVTITIEP